MTLPRIFLGPTLPVGKAQLIASLDYREPAKRGDIYRAVAHDGVNTVGFVDGYFETVPAVLHREILYALAMGVRVYGAASMGALRAAELEPFGMVGIGTIFTDYKAGAVIGDDEVAVLHAPAELGFSLLSDALVNIRYTLKKAVLCGIISNGSAEAIIATAKCRSFRTRVFKSLVADAMKELDCDLEPLIAWARDNWVDQKAVDAQLLIQHLMKQPSHGKGQGTERFIRTAHWREAIEDMELYIS